MCALSIAVAFISILDDFSTSEQCQVYFVKTRNKSKETEERLKQTFSFFLASLVKKYTHA